MAKIKWMDPFSDPSEEHVVLHADAPHRGVHCLLLGDGYYYACDSRKMNNDEIPALGPFRSMAAAERAAQRKFNEIGVDHG